jgi:hypothetical protein
MRRDYKRRKLHLQRREEKKLKTKPGEDLALGT